jgi:hypothetical protein
MTRAYYLNEQPKKLPPIDPPEQELFLEVETQDGPGQVYLDEIAEMPDKVLSGFLQWLHAKHASLTVEEELYGYREVGGEKIPNKALRFKKKIYGVFLHRAGQEQKDRKAAKKEWLDSYKDKQNENEPCQWLAEFGLPVTYSGMKTRHKQSKDYAGAIRRFINGVRRLVGDDKCNTLIESSGLVTNDEYSFMAYLKSMSGTVNVAFME